MYASLTYYIDGLAAAVVDLQRCVGDAGCNCAVQLAGCTDRLHPAMMHHDMCCGIWSVDGAAMIGGTVSDMHHNSVVAESRFFFHGILLHKVSLSVRAA